MKSYPGTHLGTALFLAACLIAVFTLVPAPDSESQTVPVSLAVKPAIPVAAPAATVTPEPATAVQEWTEVTIRKGDSLSRIFDRHDIPARELQLLMTSADTKPLTRIQPGQTLRLDVAPDGKLVRLEYDRSSLRTLSVQRGETGFSAVWNEAETEVFTTFKQLTITEEQPSLYHAGKAAGLSDSLIMKLSYIFQWDLSFALDLRQGDVFSIMFEEIYADGERVGDGEILAAEIINMGRTHTAVRYEDQRGRGQYYTPDGMSLRKAFIRDPVHFSHVSSRFNLKRLHPIHKRVMPHRGIDYAAPRGTPVVAAGDGRITIARQNNASGKYVVIQHGEQYTTKYLHLNGFAKGIRPGKQVEQGQVIGYVGDTGWATAPHLHYEFLVGGVHRNPRRVKLPKAEPVPVSERASFDVATAPLLLKLAALTGKTSYASADETTRTQGTL